MNSIQNNRTFYHTKYDHKHYQRSLQEFRENAIKFNGESITHRVAIREVANYRQTFYLVPTYVDRSRFKGRYLDHASS